MKKTQDDTNIWENIPCSWIGRIHIFKMIILLWAIYRFDTISIKIPMAFFCRTRTNNFKICMEIQNILNSQNNLKK